MHFIVLDCSSITDIDTTAHAAFKALVEEFVREKITLLLASVRPSLRDIFVANGLLNKVIQESHVYVDVDSASKLGCLHNDSDVRWGSE